MLNSFVCASKCHFCFWSDIVAHSFSSTFFICRPDLNNLLHWNLLSFLYKYIARAYTSENTDELWECGKRPFVTLCSMSQSSAPSVSVIQSVLVRITEQDTFICLSLTITSLLSVTKEYLKSLGNSECSPQTFLENSGSLDKLLIIIQNEDIAAHVHKVWSALLNMIFSVMVSLTIVQVR